MQQSLMAYIHYNFLITAPNFSFPILIPVKKTPKNKPNHPPKKPNYTIQKFAAEFANCFSGHAKHRIRLIL